MQLVLSNGYSHVANEVFLNGMNRKANLNSGEIVSSYTVSWVMSGFLQADSQSALTTALVALQNAYSADGFIARFLDNSGASTVHVLGEGARGGCKVSNFGYITQSPAEYSTFRSYTITLEAEYDNPYLQIDDFSETITWKGNCGPRILWKKNLNGPPQQQITYPQTTQRIVQRGIIVGKHGYVAPPPPLWPQYALNEDEELSNTSPHRYGPLGKPYYQGFPQAYAYYFESPFPLFGRPTLWTP